MTVYVNGEGQNTTNSAGIVDGSIVNADINSSAAIAASKISGTALVASTADAKGDLYVASAADTVGRLAVGADGSVPTANSGDTAGIGYAYPEHGGLSSRTRALTNFHAATLDPLAFNNTNCPLADGTVRGHSLYLPYDATLTGVSWIVGVQGSYTADNNNKIGLYSSDGTTLTLVAASADTPTLWSASASLVFKNTDFATPYAAQAGVYWVAWLYNTSSESTAPQVRGAAAAAVAPTSTRMRDTDEFFNWTLAAQTDLPASVAWSGVTQGGLNPMLAVY